MTTPEYIWCWNHCLVSPGNRLTIVKIMEMSLLCSKSLPQLIWMMMKVTLRPINKNVPHSYWKFQRVSLKNIKLFHPTFFSSFYNLSWSSATSPGLVHEGVSALPWESLIFPYLVFKAPLPRFSRVNTLTQRPIAVHRLYDGISDLQIKAGERCLAGRRVWGTQIQCHLLLLQGIRP